MAQLRIITLSGADDGVNPADLRRLSAENKAIEWGILYDPDMAGQPEYPSKAWIKALNAHEPMQCSLHVCGRAIHALLQGDREMVALAAPFTRIQLNIWQKRDPVDEGVLADFIKCAPVPVVLAFNQNNAQMVTNAPPQTHILFDRSGGQGKLPAHWPHAWPQRFCGYAGGLNADNLPQQLPLIFAAAGEQPLWIDMEKGLRAGADNQFSLQRVEQVLNTIKRLCP